MLLQRLFFLISLLTLANLVEGQTGPGGVGNMAGSTGQPSVRVWFKADGTVSTKPSGKVLSWIDASGRGVSVVSNTDTTKCPLLVSNAVNSKPVVRFYGLSGGRMTGSFSSSTAAGAMTFAAVVRDNGSTQTIGGVLTFDGYQGLYCGYDLTYGGPQYLVDGNGANNTKTASTQTTLGSGFRLVTGIYKQANTNSSQIFMDGKLEQLFGTTGGVSVSAFSNLEIGGRTWGGQLGRIFNGDVAEVIAFQTGLDSAQRVIMENYLAAKYNLAITGNRFAYATTSRTDVSGIGQAVNGSQHLEASSSIVTIKTPQTLANNRYMLFGHNNLSASALNTGELPNNDIGFTRRISREWRFAKTGGDLGAVTVTTDWSALNGTLPTGYSRGIWVDADGDFRSGATYYDLTQVGATNVWQATSINIPDGYYLTVGAVKRVVSFSTAAQSGYENVTEYPTLTATLNYPYAAGSGQNVTVNYSVAPLGPNAAVGPSADPDDDFNSTRTTATISAGSSSINLNAGAVGTDAALQITNDGLSEPNSETVQLTINSVSANANIGSTPSQTYYILDDDFLRKIAFTANQSGTWNELNQGQYLDTAVTVTLNTGQTGGPTTVYVVATGPAKAGQDYIFRDAALNTDSLVQITIPAGKNTARCRIRLLGDNLNENSEILTLSLFDPESGTLSQTNPTTATITIVDNDPLPTLRFRKGAETITEAAGTLQVYVRLSAVSGRQVTVPFTATAGLAQAAGADYDVITPSPLYINAGDTSAIIEVAITNDDVEEDDEDFSITLNTPTNAGLGSPTTATRLIMDDDVYGATGIGGVGKTDGSSSLELWLAADNQVTVSTNTVTTWADLAGHSTRNATQVGSFNRPTFISNGLNGKPVVRFSFTMIGATLSPGLPASPLAIFAVSKQNSTPGLAGGRYYGGIISTGRWAGLTSTRNKIISDGFDQLTPFVYPDSTNTSNTNTLQANLNTFQIYSNQYTQNSTLGSSIWRNGTLEETCTGTAPYPKLEPHTDYRLGVRYPNNSGHWFNGDVAEVAMFSGTLNGARRLIIENYLATKYNLTISNRRYSGYDAAYVVDVAGIGTTDGVSANKHRTGSSTGLTLRQLNNSLDANNEYLMIGHTSVTPGLVVQQVQGTLTEVWSRAYYLKKTGSVDARFTFNYSDVGLTNGVVVVNEYYLLYKSTANGTYSKLTVSNKTLNGNSVSFDVANSVIADGYYTLGKTDASVLPVTFSSITATRAVGGAQIRWTTGSEQNSDRFEVERSQDLKSWSTAGTVRAAGYSDGTLSYSFFDEKAPRSSVYYRLKQVDRDGRYMYSPVREVGPSLAESFAQLTLFPIPALESVNLRMEGSDATIQDVQILDLRGRILLVKALDAGQQEYEVSLAGLKAGIYLVRCQLDNGETHTRRLVKQ